MLLADYLDAVEFRSAGTVDPNEWVDVFRQRAGEAAMQAFL